MGDDDVLVVVVVEPVAEEPPTAVPDLANDGADTSGPVAATSEQAARMEVMAMALNRTRVRTDMVRLQRE
jgi:hypothetical protein